MKKGIGGLIVTILPTLITAGADLYKNRKNHRIEKERNHPLIKELERKIEEMESMNEKKLTEMKYVFEKKLEEQEKRHKEEMKKWRENQ